MIELPPSSKYRQQADAPVSDEERSDLADRLGEQYTSGVLDDDEYRGHLDLVFGARTLGELVPVVEALPPKATHHTPAIAEHVGSGRPGEVTQSRNVLPVTFWASIGAVGLILVIAVLVAILLL